MAQPQQPQLVQLPPAPADPSVVLPGAPGYPPNNADVINAAIYRQDVENSFRSHVHPQVASQQDLVNAIIYEHAVNDQAAAAAAPVAAAPAWFAAAWAQIRNEVAGVRIDQKKLMNNSRLDGRVIPFEIVPFIDGHDPTVQGPQPLDVPLPPLRSANDVDNLTAAEVVRYLNGYGRLVAHGAGAMQARRNELKDAIGAVKTR